MKKFKCEICNTVHEIDNISNVSSCPSCGTDSSFLKLIEEENEIKVYPKITGPIPIADDNPGINRIDEKCIKCGRCSTICQEQVGIKYDPKKAKEPVCLSCGQCIINCPVGALTPKYCYKKVLDYLHDTSKVVVAFTSPSVRVALGEEFDLEEVNVEGKMVSSIKKLGFDYVLDTTFGADLTIMEEASELIDRIKNKKTMPQFTSCCPAWIKYLEIYHPKLIDHLSTCKSPIGMQGSVIKNYYSLLMDIPKEDIIAVAITPCTAKKYEITLPNNKDTDFVITTTELAMMIKEANIDFKNLEDSSFDSIMSRGSGAGVIFGASGGVMEAAVRTAYYLITGKNPPKELLDFKEIRGNQNIKETSVTINEIKLNLLVVHGLKNIEPYLKELEKNNTLKYDFIEVMNCPGGCIGGGGQPLKAIHNMDNIRQKRIQALYDEDTLLTLKNSYENQDIINIYKSYLISPFSEKSHKLLHTSYENKQSILGE